MILKKSDEYKMHLTMKPKFMSSTDDNEKLIMYSKSDNKIVLISNNNEKIIKLLYYLKDVLSIP